MTQKAVFVATDKFGKCTVLEQIDGNTRPVSGFSVIRRAPGRFDLHYVGESILINGTREETERRARELATASRIASLALQHPTEPPVDPCGSIIGAISVARNEVSGTMEPDALSGKDAAARLAHARHWLCTAIALIDADLSRRAAPDLAPIDLADNESR